MCVFFNNYHYTCIYYYMGWHEQGDGKLFLGINIEQSCLKDYDDGPPLLKVTREIIEN